VFGLWFFAGRNIAIRARFQRSRGPSAVGPLESRKTPDFMRFSGQGSTNGGERGTSSLVDN
jgi:hypothetical protein